MLIANFHQVNQWQSIIVASYFPYKFFYDIAVPSNIWNKRCLPLRTVDMRALGVAN